MTRQLGSKHCAPLPPHTALSAKYEHDWAEEITVEQAGPPRPRSKLSVNYTQQRYRNYCTIFHDNCQ